MRFEARDLTPFSEPLEPTQLKVGATYFAVTYVDQDMLLPVLEPLVYVGKDLEAGDSEQLYFQDADSYLRGVRYDSANDEQLATFHTGDAIKHVFEYERAVDELLRCSLRRKQRKGE